MKIKKSFVYLLFMSVGLFLIIQSIGSTPYLIKTSTFKEYKIEVFQSKNKVKLNYYDSGILSQEKEFSIDKNLEYQNIEIQWIEDSTEQLDGKLYSQLTINVKINIYNDTIVLFDKTIVDATEPID